MSAKKSFCILAADHTGFTVANLERSLAFWRDVLGFELSHRPHQTGDLASEITGVPGAEISIAVLKGYGHKIELLEYLAPPDRKHFVPRPCDVGSVHVAFTKAKRVRYSRRPSRNSSGPSICSSWRMTIGAFR